MEKVDIVFYIISICCYFSILFYFSDLVRKRKRVLEIEKKRESEELRLSAIREKGSIKKTNSSKNELTGLIN